MGACKNAPHNIRVVVTPKISFYDANEESLYRRGMADQRLVREHVGACHRIADAIRRHVDDVDGAIVEYDQWEVCEYCGHRWTEDSKDYNGGCCDKDDEDDERRRLEILP